MTSHVIHPAGDGGGLHADVALPGEVRPAVFAAERIDPATGELASVTSGTHPVIAAVVTAARTERGSGAAVRETGQRFRDVRKLGPAGAELLRGESRRMFAPLVAQHLVRVLNVDVRVDEHDQSASVTTTWRNLLTGHEERTDS